MKTVFQLISRIEHMFQFPISAFNSLCIFVRPALYYAVSSKTLAVMTV